MPYFIGGTGLSYSTPSFLISSQNSTKVGRWFALLIKNTPKYLKKGSKLPKKGGNM